MTIVTLSLKDEIIERAAEAAKAEGISLEKMLARLLEDAFDGDVYELDEEEERAVSEGIADMRAGRWISHEEMMRALQEQRGR